MSQNTEAAQTRKGWKDYLLRSGVPLEYQVARELSKNGMFIDADFSFLRRDVVGIKEWSVDIAASYFGGRKPHDTAYILELLVECKYRSQEKLMLFLEDPNLLLPSATLGGSVSSFDFCVPYYLALGAFERFESSLKTTYKGVELHPGAAVEDDLRHAIQQLRYATPARLRRTFDFNLAADPANASAIFFAKILVTNAPIFVLKSEIDIETIKSSRDLSEIASQVDTVVLYSDYGPDYEIHFRSTFEDEKAERFKAAESVKDDLEKAGKRFGRFADPVTFITNISKASRFECHNLGAQFLVTTLKGLPLLLKEIKSACSEAYAKRTKTDPIARSLRRIRERG